MLRIVRESSHFLWRILLSLTPCTTIYPKWSLDSSSFDNYMGPTGY